jgi:hypothetical protein
MGPTFEGQISKDEKGYWLTVTISRDGSTWTSQPAYLGNDGKAAAREKAGSQMAALRKVLTGES